MMAIYKTNLGRCFGIGRCSSTPFGKQILRVERVLIPISYSIFQTIVLRRPMQAYHVSTKAGKNEVRQMQKGLSYTNDKIYTEP